jgi:hypothetical protein
MTDRDTRQSFFETTAVNRLLELIEVTRRWGRPWTARGLPESVIEPNGNWYRDYR